MKISKIQILGVTLNLTFTIGLVLLVAYVYVILYNYLYKKYRKRMSEYYSKDFFDVSSPGATIVSMIDVLLIMVVFSIRIITLKEKQ